MVAEQAGKLFADRSEGEGQVGAAFMTARGVDADERAARWAEFGTRLVVFAAAEKSLRCVLHSIDTTLPLIGNCQCASLRVILRVSIIPESQSGFREGKGRRLMDKFEEMGHKLDEELSRLRRFVEEDLAPKTEERTAQFLREVSEKLTDAAQWLDARRATRETKSKETSA